MMASPAASRGSLGASFDPCIALSVGDLSREAPNSTCLSHPSDQNGDTTLSTAAMRWSRHGCISLFTMVRG